MTVSKVKDNVSQTGHITTSVKQPLYLYGIREGNGNEGREGAAGGVSRPAYWAPASLIRPTPKKTPVA